MRVFCISDLHLPGNENKSMDVFGSKWENHWDKIRKNWIDIINQDDCVLIPGDISWAMDLNDAADDLNEIGELPGEKIIIRGNHDFWWSSITRVRRLLPPSIHALQNDSLELEGIGFCGTRGWTAPGGKDYTPHDQKIFNREVNRLKMSLDSIKEVENIIVLLHYPPFDEKGQETEMGALIHKYPVKHVVFGHIHGESLKGVVEGEINGILYHLTSCDYLDFNPKFITQI